MIVMQCCLERWYPFQAKRVFLNTGSLNGGVNLKNSKRILKFHVRPTVASMLPCNLKKCHHEVSAFQLGILDIF